jgi:hypothetical protein
MCETNVTQTYFFWRKYAAWLDVLAYLRLSKDALLQ